MIGQLSIHRDGQDWGPYSQEEASQHVASGSLLASDLAWHEGLPEWQPLGSLPEFTSLFAAPPPPPNPATALGPKLLLTPATEGETTTPDEAKAVFLKAQKLYRKKRMKSLGIKLAVVWLMIIIALLTFPSALQPILFGGVFINIVLIAAGTGNGSAVSGDFGGL